MPANESDAASAAPMAEPAPAVATDAKQPSAGPETPTNAVGAPPHDEMARHTSAVVKAAAATAPAAGHSGAIHAPGSESEVSR